MSFLCFASGCRFIKNCATGVSICQSPDENQIAVSSLTLVDSFIVCFLDFLRFDIYIQRFKNIKTLNMEAEESTAAETSTVDEDPKKPNDDDEEEEEAPLLQFHQMGLDDRLLKAIAFQGWKEPTLIQGLYGIVYFRTA